MTERDLASKVRFFAVRTTIGQEHNVALLMEERVRGRKLPVYSLSVIPGLKGLVIVEARAMYIAQQASYGIRHVRGLVRGGLKFEDIEKFVVPKPVIEMVKVNDIVEITGGPFVGMRGRVVHVDKTRGEVKVEITEATYPLPITISAELIRIISRGEEERSEG